jgi:hypothetical protein
MLTSPWYIAMVPISGRTTCYCTKRRREGREGKRGERRKERGAKGRER